SSASLPTRRSRAAMRASYSASTSAAAVSLSSPPASNLATQILIRLRPIPWRLARACSDSPPRNSWTTWRLNSIEWLRCLAMGFPLESPVQLADSHLPHLSTPRGALQETIGNAARTYCFRDLQQAINSNSSIAAAGSCCIPISASPTFRGPLRGSLHAVKVHDFTGFFDSNPACVAVRRDAEDSGR